MERVCAYRIARESKACRPGIDSFYQAYKYKWLSYGKIEFNVLYIRKKCLKWRCGKIQRVRAIARMHGVSIQFINL